LLGYFGADPSFGPGAAGRRKQRRWDQEQANFRGGDSPLLRYAQQFEGLMPQIMQQSAAAGQRAATMAPEQFQLLNRQIMQAMQGLGGIQQGAGENTQMAQQARDQAFNPIASNALYQNALQGGLDSARQGAAGRGLLDAGATQGMESEMARDLASQFAARQFQEQQQSLGGVSGALGQQAGLLPMGAQLAQMRGQGIQEMLGLMQQGYQIPAQALQGIFAQLAGFANPAMGVAQTAAPSVVTTSRGSGFNIL
jgi:hypothetical protein